MVRDGYFLIISERFIKYDWDAVAGEITVVLAIILHLLYIIQKVSPQVFPSIIYFGLSKTEIFYFLTSVG